jgi:NAD(P)H-flavin reductase
MKKFISVVILLLFAAGFVYAKDYMVKKELENFTVNLQIDKNPPVSGENKVQISIQDKTGNYITDATVAVEYSMPAMPGMPAINYKSTTELKDKQYTANLNFSMSGAWTVSIKITRAGKTQSVKFNVDVS